MRGFLSRARLMSQNSPIKPLPAPRPPKSETKFFPLPTPTPIPLPIPPPEPPPKPLEEPPPMRPEFSDDIDTEGTSGKAIVAEALFVVIRAGVFAVVFGLFGCSRVWNCLAFSPAAPPPEPVAKLPGSFLTDSFVTEIIRKAAISTKMTWMVTDTTKPSPPTRCHSGRRRLGTTSSEGVSLTGGNIRTQR